jgi:hypothetical protein
LQWCFSGGWTGWGNPSRRMASTPNKPKRFLQIRLLFTQ